MAVIYSSTVKDSRLSAVVSSIGTTGVLQIGTTGMTTVLATIPLANPAGTVSAGVLTFTMPASDNAADSTGTAAAARIRTSAGGTDIVTGLTVTATGGGGDITLDNTSIASGQVVTISSATITHA